MIYKPDVLISYYSVKFYLYLLVHCSLFTCIMWIWVPEIKLWTWPLPKGLSGFVLYKNFSLFLKTWVFMFICRYISNGYGMVLIDWLTLELDHVRGIRIRTNLLKLGWSGNNHRLTASFLVNETVLFYMYAFHTFMTALLSHKGFILDLGANPTSVNRFLPKAHTIPWQLLEILPRQ